MIFLKSLAKRLLQPLHYGNLFELNDLSGIARSIQKMISRDADAMSAVLGL